MAETAVKPSRTRPAAPASTRRARSPAPSTRCEQPVGLVEEGARPPRSARPGGCRARGAGRPPRFSSFWICRDSGGWVIREPLGGAAEVQLLGDGDEGAHLVEGDHAASVVDDARRISFHAESGLDGHHRALLVSAVTERHPTALARSHSE